MEKKDKKNPVEELLKDIGIVKSNCGKAIRLWEEKDKKERFIRENLEKLQENAERMYIAYHEIHSTKLYEKDPAISDYVKKFEPEMSGMVDYSRKFHTLSSDVKRKVDDISGMTSSAVLDIGTGMAYTDTYFDYHLDNEEYKPIIIKWKETGPISEKDDLLFELGKFDSKLKDFFNRIWDSLLYKGITRGEILPAHSMREFMSDFLQVLDPTNKVKSMPWCIIPKNSGNPTHRSRVIFSILENDKKFTWEKEKYKPYHEIATKYRKLYQKLDKYSHYRNDELPFDIRFKLKNYIKLLQNYVKEIINQRESHYSNEIPTKWDHIYQYLPDGACMNIRFNCSNCNRELILYSYELPTPFMGGDKHEDSYRYGEKEIIECYKCDTVFEIEGYNSIPGWMISFDGDNVPNSFKFRILKYSYF